MAYDIESLKKKAASGQKLSKQELDYVRKEIIRSKYDGRERYATKLYKDIVIPDAKSADVYGIEKQKSEIANLEKKMQSDDISIEELNRLTKELPERKKNLQRDLKRESNAFGHADRATRAEDMSNNDSVKTLEEFGNHYFDYVDKGKTGGFDAMTGSNQGTNQGSGQNTGGQGGQPGSYRGSYSTETTNYRGGERTGQEGNVDDMTDIRYGNNLPDTPLTNTQDFASTNYQGASNISQNPEFNYRSTGSDIPGYLIDIGRTVLGTKGAMEEVPTYEPSQMFQDYTQESANMRNTGLSPDELAFARGQAEKGYAYDVKNIGRFAGGSSGVALANLGRATNQLQDAYGNISMRDEATRRMNRQAFGQAALASEDVNRQMFNDKMSLTMMNKQSGAQLANDALMNILNRRDFEHYYGKGSLNEAYKNEMLKETALNNQAMGAQIDYYQRGYNTLNNLNQQKTNPTSINVDTEITPTQVQTTETTTNSNIPSDAVTVQGDGYQVIEYSKPGNNQVSNSTSTITPPPQNVIDYRNAEFNKFMEGYEPKKTALQSQLADAPVGSRKEKMLQKQLDDLMKEYTDFQTKIGSTEEVPNYYK